MYKSIPADTFNEMVMDAGMLLKNFDPASPAAPAEADKITATTGGITITCVPTVSDLGEDVDNVMNGSKELMHLDYWDAGITTTAVKTSADVILLALGAADKDTQTGKITPRSKINQTDFQDIWWVGDKAGGGVLACKLKNALSNGGLSIQATKNSKGQLALDLKGHPTILDPDDPPIECYSID